MELLTTIVIYFFLPLCAAVVFLLSLSNWFERCMNKSNPDNCPHCGLDDVYTVSNRRVCADCHAQWIEK